MISVEDIFPKYYNVMGSVWRCLYEKEFIDKFNLKFKQGISIMEDLIFNIEALIYCDRVCIDQGVYYHYVRNRSSVLRSYNEKMWHDQVLVHNTLENILRDAELDEYMRNRLDLRYLGMAACALGNEVYDRDANLIGKMEKAKYIMNDKRLKEVLDRSKVYNIESLREHRNKDEKESREDSERVTNVIKNLHEHIM
jgi:hypothetical protein